jgi:hypothetical protein
MKRITSLSFWCVVAIGAAQALTSFAQQQSPFPGNGKNRSGKSADDAWADLTTLATSANPAQTMSANPAQAAPANLATLTTPANSTQSAPGQQKTKDQKKADRLQKADSARQTATAAKAFYADFPDHVNAHAAKKLEALSSVDATVGASPDDKKAALQVAGSFRTNHANAPADRFEVAVAMDRTSLSEKFGGELYTNNPAELEALAERLHTEFGDIAECLSFYVSVARTADLTTASRMAKNLLQWPATAEVKAEAQSIMNRAALLGTTLQAKLTTTDGTIVDLAQQAGKVTIIYAWLPGSPGSLGLMNRVKSSLPKDAQIIYACAGATKQQLNAAKKALAVPGTLTNDSSGAPGGLATLLKIQQWPCVIGLDRSGKLAAFGPIDALGLVVATAAGRTTVNP